MQNTKSAVQPEPGPRPLSRNDQVVARYLEEHSAAFRKVREARLKYTKGDDHFRAGRAEADEADANGQQRMHEKMSDVATELHRMTQCFHLAIPQHEPSAVLDLCMAPGAFFLHALDANGGAFGTTYTLPMELGGHETLLPTRMLNRMTLRELDLNLLAANRGLAEEDIPDEHLGKGHLRPLELVDVGRPLDIAICDGAVKRTHRRVIAYYRQDTEEFRLQLVQLALALGHLKTGGTIIVRLHQIDHWHTVKLRYLLSKFAQFKAHKLTVAHQVKSSFYVVATEVDSECADALKAVESWKAGWRAATLMKEGEHAAYLEQFDLDPDIVLQEFGQRHVELGEQVWKV
ncbi:hypothetical protein LTR95_017976 [Oleoguttula sp. CCFEE 5521]